MQSPRSLLLITVDCFRADHAGFLGYRRSTTPFLDSLAKESVVFSNAIVAGDVSGCSPGNGSECRILRVSCDFRNVDVVLSGHQQARAVALVPPPMDCTFPPILRSNQITCTVSIGKEKHC